MYCEHDDEELDELIDDIVDYLLGPPIAVTIETIEVIRGDGFVMVRQFTDSFYV